MTVLLSFQGMDEKVQAHVEILREKRRREQEICENPDNEA